LAPDAPRPPEETKRRPLFFWIALSTGTAFLAVFAAGAVHAIRDARFARDPGWSGVRGGDHWVVERVVPGGAAAGKLEPGDEILAQDGDARAARVGPGWVLRDRDLGLGYILEVRRNAATIAVPLVLAVRDDPAFLGWVAVWLAVGLAHWGVGLLIALAKPESRPIRYGFAGSLLTAAFMLWLALRPQDGIRPGALVLVAGSVFPLYFILGYRFFDAFPVPIAAGRRWRWVWWSLLVVGLAVWLPRALLNLLRGLGTDVLLGALDRWPRLLRLGESAIPPAELLYAAAATAAIFAVLFRNYRALPEGVDRRRLGLVIASQALAVVPACLQAGFAAGASVLGLGERLAGAIDLSAKAANAFAIVTPIALGYAVVKHRVLGVRVFVRLGVQYLLARNVLRAAVVLPLAWLAYTVAAHPERTLGQVFSSTASGLNLAVAALAVLGLRFNRPLAAAIDRRFFRDAYDQQQILLRLVESIKQHDSILEISAMVSREIDTALHVTRVVVLYRNRETHGFSIGYSSAGTGAELDLPEGSPLLQELGRTTAARTDEELRGRATAEESGWLDRLGVRLLVPIPGIDRDLVGVLMLGEKRSEEPFTSKDNTLLQTVAGQIGAVYEVLALREKVGRQERVQTEMLARLDRQSINLMKQCTVCGTCYDSSAARCERDGHPLGVELPVDRTVDRKYRLERLLGRGGMGAVYEATDLRLDRKVALKLMTGRFLGSSGALRRFTREAQASARLEHARIVRVYDYGSLGDDAAYLVMELVPGVTWRAELRRRGAFPLALAADRLEQVLDGVAAAHRAGVLHRDLKPDNLLICPAANGRPDSVKILDFGLAKVRELGFVDPKSATTAGITMGTFGYMSPEQFYGEEVDERTDIFSLGVIALETLTGKLTLEGRFFHRTIETELEQRLVAPARTDAHRALAQALAACLAPARSARLSSIEAARAALLPAIRGCSDLPLPPPGAEEDLTELPTRALPLGEA
jgi:eukaryotic-like serine/threonine-protein kinase